MSPQIVLYGYDTSPYTKKIKQVLTFLSLPYSSCVQPRVLPRPDLASIGVRYRRIPVLSIDGDMYCDTTIIVAKLCALAGVYNTPQYAAIGDAMFSTVVGTIPSAYLEQAGEGFLKDRSDMAGFNWTLDMQEKGRPVARSALIVYADMIEKDLLQDGYKTFFEETKATVADLHIYWVLSWAIETLQSGKGIIEKDGYPNLFKWLDGVKKAIGEPKFEEIEFAEAKKLLTTGKKVDVLEVSSIDPLGLKEGQEISVVPTDNSKNHPTKGKLVALTPQEVCIETQEGVRVHFPRLKFAIS